MKAKVGVGLFLAVLLLLAQIVAVEAADTPNSKVAPINSSSYGKTYSEWAVAFWQWLLPLDLANNPANTGNCASAPQPQEKVFLLGAGWGKLDLKDTTVTTIACTLKPGTALFFPLLADARFETDQAIPDLFYGLNNPPGNNPAAWTAAQKEAFKPDKMILQVSLDGVAFSEKDLKNYFVSSGSFETTFYLNPDYPALKVTVASGGYFLLFHPLPPGHHTIMVSVQLTSGYTYPGLRGADIYSIPPVRVDTLYHLNVTPGTK